MRLKDIENKYEKNGKKFGGVLLLPPDAACKFIDEGIANGYRLSGVEGFKIYGNKIKPYQEHSNDIADYTSVTVSFAEHTKEFIQQRKNKGIWFEVVFSAMDESEQRR